MTETERKALALAIETRVDDRYRLCPDPTLTFGLWEALCRAIEQHEAFRQEVSDAVEGLKKVWGRGWRQCSEATMCDRFIIAKPDPLVDAWQMAFPGNHIEDSRDECAKIIAAIEARGGRIVWGEG